MLKPLSAEGRFECGMNSIIAKHHGHWAFVSVIGKHYGARLGLVVRDEPGYYPIPEFWAHADTMTEMDAHADELNAAEGLTPHQCTEIVISTMRGNPRR